MKKILPAILAAGVLATAAGQTAPPPQVAQKPGVLKKQFPTSTLVPDAEYAIEGSPDWLAIGDDTVWVNSKPKDYVARMDPKTNQVVAKVPVTKPCSGLIIGAGSLWSPSCEENVLYRIDLATNKTVAKLPVAPSNTEGGIAFGAGSVWMPSDPKGIVSRIDPTTNQATAKIAVPEGSHTAIYGYGLVWVSSTDKSVVSVIHPASNAIIATIPVDGAPRFMAVGEGFVWTLNQTRGTVSKIDPYTKSVVATIDAGVAGTGGEIAAGEGAVWVTARTIPVTRIDPASNKVTHQFYGPGGDAIEAGHGSVWLSNGRWSNVWRMLPSKIVSAGPQTWMSNAVKSDVDSDGQPDMLVEDLAVWMPGEPATFHMALLNEKLGEKFTLKVLLNGKDTTVPFERSGKEWTATFTGDKPRWIHYAVCVPGTGMCTQEFVTASPTTPLAYAKKQAKFVPDTFLAPGVPLIGDYVWNILEPTILTQDYDALMNRYGGTGPSSITKIQDHGELKRHEWEFRNNTAFSWGILTADKKTELACVYINPSAKKGYDAVVRLWVTKQGAEVGLEPVLEAKVREWVKEKWPFQKVIYPGRDMPMADFNALPSAE